MAVSQALPRIAIVDDDPGSRATLAAALDELAGEIVELPSGAELLARLPRLAPDVILLDVLMPDLDGFAVCRRLKQNPATRAIPIILITALDSVEDLVRGLDAGADEFLSKPVARLELQARVRTMLRIKAQVDELAQAIALRERLAHLTTHDLRTPLTAVMLQLELLRRHGGLATEQAERVATALAEAQSMSAYLDDMLLLMRLEGGRHILQSRPVDLGHVAQRAAGRFADFAQVRRVLLQTAWDEPAPTIPGDPLLLPRLVENLVAGALKCAPSDSQILLRVVSDASAPLPMVRVEAIVGAASATELPPTPVGWTEVQGSVQVEAMRAAEWETVFCRWVAEVHHGRLAVFQQRGDIALVAMLPGADIPAA